MTNNVHYENYRFAKLSGIAQEGKFQTKDGKDPMAQMEAEKKEHENKMKKMEAEMRQVFELKVRRLFCFVFCVLNRSLLKESTGLPIFWKNWKREILLLHVSYIYPFKFQFFSAELKTLRNLSWRITGLQAPTARSDVSCSVETSAENEKVRLKFRSL